MGHHPPSRQTETSDRFGSIGLKELGHSAADANIQNGRITQTPPGISRSRRRSGSSCCRTGQRGGPRPGNGFGVAARSCRVGLLGLGIAWVPLYQHWQSPRMAGAECRRVHEAGRSSAGESSAGLGSSVPRDRIWRVSSAYWTATTDELDARSAYAADFTMAGDSVIGTKSAASFNFCCVWSGSGAQNLQ
jgi:hypothetical protein